MLGYPDLSRAPALRQGRRALRCIRNRRWRQLLRWRFAGRAKPDPVDHLLRGPLDAERDRHPQALTRAVVGGDRQPRFMMARLGAARLTALALVLALAGASGCGGDGDGGTRLGSL